MAESPSTDRRPPARSPGAGSTRARVSAFDEPRGIGEVMTDDGLQLRFHCTAIADGTRTIPVGVDVEVEVVNGPLGDYEAAHLRPA
jgi:cold shock CspA family protein